MKRYNLVNSVAWNILLLTLGSVIFSIGINRTVVHNAFIIGGVFGAALLLDYKISLLFAPVRHVILFGLTGSFYTPDIFIASIILVFISSVSLDYTLFLFNEEGHQNTPFLKGKGGSSKKTWKASSLQLMNTRCSL